MRRSARRFIIALLACAGALVAAGALLSSCALLRDLAAGIRKPEARVVGTEIEALSFESVSLRFDVEITNPNAVGIEMAGFDYALAIEGEPFISGAVDRQVSLVASGRSVVPVPVEFTFEKVLATVGKLAAQDEFAYGLDTGFTFDLPVLGRVRVPVRAAGTLPVVRAPRVRVSSLQVQSLSLSGASLLLGLDIENRNGFGLSVDGLSYAFSGNGQPWAAGSMARALRLEPHAQGRVDLAFQIGFAALGRSAYQLLLGGGPLRYDLRADLDLGTSLPVMPRAALPLRLDGEVQVSR